LNALEKGVLAEGKKNSRNMKQFFLRGKGHMQTFSTRDLAKTTGRNISGHDSLVFFLFSMENIIGLFILYIAGKRSIGTGREGNFLIAEWYTREGIKVNLINREQTTSNRRLKC